ncbi:PucR-like helix-turn-helix protein [Nocardia tenerifensis]|uniref:PucR-like helix-turn-helix protein n=1 Tax=Nocardia tenerifensis TaxID=228006 RepID=A0A318JRJ0_9NOCA|nr:helix-turn-helix domain-containing protein [Nocardia tenerifensis]PXX58436.1 PucR-like helix-turn-helix protein [Nocardia tenerifensis]
MPVLDPTHRLVIDEPFLARLLLRISDLKSKLVTTVLRSFPALDQLPDRRVADCFASVAVELFLSAIRAIDDGREFTDEEMAGAIAPLAELCAEERLSVRTLISGGFAVTIAVWNEAASVARPVDMTDMFALNRLLLDCLGRAMAILLESRSHSERPGDGLERQARRALCDALVSGAPTTTLAVQADMVVSERYALIALHVRLTEGVDPQYVNFEQRRRIDLVQNELDRFAGTAALHTFDGRAGVVLLPADEVAPDPARLLGLASCLTEWLGEPVIMIDFGAVSLAGLPAAATQALEFGQLAAGLERPPGVYGTDDLLLEYQLVRPGVARDRLAARIRPLIGQKHLLEALEAHVRHGWDRQRAAEEIHLHPNSLTYRLRRIGDITGLNPLHPHESRMLAAALIIHRLYPAERPA